MLTLGNTNCLLHLVLWVAGISEEYIESTIVKDNDELVGIFALSHGFKPTDVLDSAFFLYYFGVIIFYHYALFFEHWVVAAYHACLCSKKELQLWLVLGLLFIILTLIFLIFNSIHIGILK